MTTEPTTDSTDSWHALTVVIERVFVDLPEDRLLELLVSLDTDVYADTVAATGFDPEA